MFATVGAIFSSPFLISGGIWILQTLMWRNCFYCAQASNHCMALTGRVLIRIPRYDCSTPQAMYGSNSEVSFNLIIKFMMLTLRYFDILARQWLIAFSSPLCSLAL